MNITDIDKDFDNLTLTLVAEFDAPVERVWELWADPRKLERWWGPPGYPSTFDKHELSPGGDVAYYMTSPEGERHRGWWKVSSVEPPTALEFTDGFADENGTPVEDMPVMAVRVELSENGSGTRMQMRSTFDNREDMEKTLDMGALEGIKASMGQMDALLAE